jgi:hypothetical protein
MRLAARVNELHDRQQAVYDDNRDHADYDVITLAMVTGFVCALSNEELHLLYRAVKLDYGPDKDGLPAAGVKAVLLLELGYCA